MRSASILPMILVLTLAQVSTLRAQGEGSVEERLRALEDEVRKLKDREPAAADPHSLRAYFKNGFFLETQDKAFKLGIGGRMQLDWTFVREQAALERKVGAIEDGVEFRRVRLSAEGALYRNVEFKTEFDFAGGAVAYKTVALSLKNVPCAGKVTVGHHFEPFGLETQTSSKYTTFMERSFLADFAPERSTGLSLSNTALHEMLAWSAGAFRDGNASGDRTGDGEQAWTGRLTSSPLYGEEGRKLLHLGAAYHRRELNKNAAGVPQLRLRSRPEAHLLPRFVDTGNLNLQELELAGGEAALVLGPFSLQGEYAEAATEGRAARDPEFTTWYGQASFFLTGEHRPYKRATGLFDRVKPLKNFHDGPEGGCGAWELALRRSELDLDDRGAGVAGGRLRDHTLGLNWYLNPNTRVMGNYVRADLRNQTDDADIFMVRFHIDF